MRSGSVLPGDEVAMIEEFLPSINTYEYDGYIRSTGIGRVVYDVKSRAVSVNTLKDVLPEKGDHVIGFVYALQANIVTVRILSINGRSSNARLDSVYISKGKVKPYQLFRVGDIVRARILALLNGYIYITFKDDDLGVIYTKCSSCGGDVVKINDDEIKCIECNTISTRRLAKDYGNIDVLTTC